MAPFPIKDALSFTNATFLYTEIKQHQLERNSSWCFHNIYYLLLSFDLFMLTSQCVVFHVGPGVIFKHEPSAPQRCKALAFTAARLTVCQKLNFEDAGSD